MLNFLLTKGIHLLSLAGEMTPRLVNGAHWSGRLEVLEDGIWNTVCDREFGNNEAQVVCRMLGLNRCAQDVLK